MQFSHITLLNNHRVTQSSKDIDLNAVNFCKKLLPNGGKIPAESDLFRVEIAKTVFTIWHGNMPCVSCAVGGGLAGNDAWDPLCKLQAKFAPVMATTIPRRGYWLAVALLPGLMQIDPKEMDWIGDFERCLAMAIFNNFNKSI